MAFAQRRYKTHRPPVTESDDAGILTRNEALEGTQVFDRQRHVLPPRIEDGSRVPSEGSEKRHTGTLQSASAFSTSESEGWQELELTRGLRSSPSDTHSLSPDLFHRARKSSMASDTSLLPSNATVSENDTCLPSPYLLDSSLEWARTGLTTDDDLAFASSDPEGTGQMAAFSYLPAHDGEGYFGDTSAPRLSQTATTSRPSAGNAFQSGQESEGMPDILLPGGGITGPKFVNKARKLHQHLLSPTPLGPQIDMESPPDTPLSSSLALQPSSSLYKSRDGHPQYLTTATDSITKLHIPFAPTRPISPQALRAALEKAPGAKSASSSPASSGYSSSDTIMPDPYFHPSLHLKSSRQLRKRRHRDTSEIANTSDDEPRHLRLHLRNAVQGLDAQRSRSESRLNQFDLDSIPSHQPTSLHLFYPIWRIHSLWRHLVQDDKEQTWLGYWMGSFWNGFGGELGFGGGDLDAMRDLLCLEEH
ncbi:hypothetical protein BZG36_01463 [Bifiguratus adelaidae]|uniref:Uncharacterized protein n=1 Tax=Bifiguratus adelaidae TaxID=1938954 RepID=A0A261Y4V7_9FUNG|nr:hypothetical protein BZG36_01463 [Bifiguratus adelaidae]